MILIIIIIVTIIFIINIDIYIYIPGCIPQPFTISRLSAPLFFRLGVQAAEHHHLVRVELHAPRAAGLRQADCGQYDVHEHPGARPEDPGWPRGWPIMGIPETNTEMVKRSGWLEWCDVFFFFFFSEWQVGCFVWLWQISILIYIYLFIHICHMFCVQ